jgi:hypothetical protein
VEVNVKVRAIYAVTAGALTLAGCGRESGGSVAEFVEVCTAQSGFTNEICECIGELAGEELSANGLSFLTASIGSDAGRAEAFSGQLEAEEAMAAGMFMVGAPARCLPESP